MVAAAAAAAAAATTPAAVTTEAAATAFAEAEGLVSEPLAGMAEALGLPVLMLLTAVVALEVLGAAPFGAALVFALVALRGWPRVPFVGALT